MKLLLVEDDLKVAEHLCSRLKDHGFNVSHVASKPELDQCLEDGGKVDVIILDRLLSTYDSKDSVPKLKQKWPSAPIIVLSAISTPNERGDLLNLGADDYLGKPFSSHELLARIRAQLRKTSAPIGSHLQVGSLVIDLIKRVASVRDTVISLPAKEFSVLRTLCQEPGRVWSKAELLDYVWGQSSDVETNVVESTVANIRKKLSEIESGVSIKNMRNSGYWIEN